MSLIDDYHLLQIPTNATERDVKAAFRRLARQYHPDKNPDYDTTELFQRLQAAYQNVLNAIKSGTQPQDWQPYYFSNEARPSPFAKSGFNFKNDKAQEEYVRERQRAYEEMKRNNAKQDKARDEAIKSARNTLNERRVKALYEEAFKNNKPFESNSSGSMSFEDDTSERLSTSDDSLDSSSYEFESYFSNSNTFKKRGADGQSTATTYKLKPAKLAFQAATYIATFAAGIYATLYWQDVNISTKHEQNIAEQYIAGLYPDLRIGEAYTLEASNLYSEPSETNPPLTTIPIDANVTVQQAKGNWLALRYDDHTGWADASKFGFGTYENSQIYGCYGHPGIAPDHGDLLRYNDNSEDEQKLRGSSRLRVLNQLPYASILRFESLEGAKPFAIYLQAKRAFATNYIPRGKYKLVLESGSLYHRACQHFVFNDTEHTLMESVDFASTERSITLRP